MAKGKEPNPNPLVSDLSLVERASRNYLVNGRRSLNNTERILRQDPAAARELDRTGGLQPLLTQGTNQNQERHYLSRFVDYQTSLFIDRVTSGDILRTPTLETLFEQARENTQISISIGTELESCCSEIKSKLDDLLAQLQRGFRRLRALVIGKVVDIQTQASENFDSLTATALDTRAQVLDVLNERLNTVEVLINQANTFIQDKINERADRLEQRLATVLSTILNVVAEKAASVVDQTKALLDSLQIYIRDSFEALLFNIESALRAQAASLISSLETFYTVEVLPVLTAIGAGVTEIVGSTTYISNVVTQLLREVKTLPSKFDELLKKHLEEFKSYLDDWKKELIQEVAAEVSLQVVGESYYKWDSMSTYFPTITFLFKETDVSQYPRKSQIKLRLLKRNEEVTKGDIDKLRISCNTILNSTYSYGTQRFNYVSSDKRFKTTVFGNNTTEIKSLLSSLCKVIGDPFEERNLSITLSRNRVNALKRSSSLDGIELNTVSYQENFKVKFRKAVLLVNGLKSPIVLAEN